MEIARVLRLNTLTPNATDLLDRLSRGQTIPEIAAAWGVTPSLVYRTFRSVRLALGARTDLEAIARWARNGHQSQG